MSALVIQHSNRSIGHESEASAGHPYWIDGADPNRFLSLPNQFA